MQERQAGFSVGAEISAEAELNPREHAVEDISANVLCPGRDDCRIAHERSHHHRRDKLHQNGNNCAKSEPDGDCIAEDDLHPVTLARTDILCTQSRDRGQHRRRDQEQKADDLFHDADRRRIRQAALVRNDGDGHKGHLNKAVLQSHRNADGEHLLHRRLLRLEIGLSQLDAGFPPQNHHQRDHHTDQLRKGRAQCRTCGAKTHGPHKQEVQSDIGRASHRDEVHRTFGISQPTEDRRDDIIGRDARDAKETDGQIGHRSRNGLFRC